MKEKKNERRKKKNTFSSYSATASALQWSAFDGCYAGLGWEVYRVNVDANDDCDVEDDDDGDYYYYDERN